MPGSWVDEGRQLLRHRQGHPSHRYGAGRWNRGLPPWPGSMAMTTALPCPPTNAGWTRALLLFIGQIDHQPVTVTAGASGKTTGLMAESRSSTRRRLPFSQRRSRDLDHQLLFVLDARQVGGIAGTLGDRSWAIRAGQGEVIEIGALLCRAPPGCWSGMATPAHFELIRPGRQGHQGEERQGSRTEMTTVPEWFSPIAVRAAVGASLPVHLCQGDLGRSGRATSLPLSPATPPGRGYRRRNSRGYP